MMNGPPVRISQPLLNETTKPMASTVPATANGSVAITSSSEASAERTRVTT
jgi:hypothetical protein